MTSTDRVRQIALRMIGEAEAGVRYSVLHKAIVSECPDIPPNTITGALHRLRTNMPADVYVPAKGLYRNTKYRDPNETPVETPPSKPNRVTEEAFYERFADWITNELEECTKAIPLGGARFKDRWGTPDVIGIREPRKSDIIKPQTEIIAAEIKTDSQALIVAFGQACSYRIFSHRSYIVVPDDSAEEDLARLDALARILGIGLVLFDKAAKEPDFQIRVRASRHEPDMFYVNKYMKLIEDELFQ